MKQDKVNLMFARFVKHHAGHADARLAGFFLLRGLGQEIVAYAGLEGGAGEDML